MSPIFKTPSKHYIYLSVPLCFSPSIHFLELTAVFICLCSGVWCVTQHGKSILQSSPCWWDPSLDTWCLGSSLTGKIFSQVLSHCVLSMDIRSWNVFNHPHPFPFLLLFCRFGRHPVLIISVLFMLVFGLTVAFSVNVPMFSTLRFFEGFCLAGITLSLYVLSKS